jgi:hypothetical protein
LHFLNLFSHLDGLPQVRVRPSTAVIPSSSEARLVCESSDTPIVSVAYWTYVGQRIELNPSIIEMRDNELRIFRFGDTAYTQPGAYACVVSTRYGLLESEPAMLSLPSKSFMFILNINSTSRQLFASLSRCMCRRICLNETCHNSSLKDTKVMPLFFSSPAAFLNCSNRIVLVVSRQIVPN